MKLTDSGKSLRFIAVCCLLPWLIQCSSSKPNLAKTENDDKQESVAEKPQNPAVVLRTTKGEITIELLPKKAPKSVENFLQYVRDGFYDGTIFHRVIPDFMIQCGALTADLKPKKTREPVQNEAKRSIKNSRGTVTMARRSGRNSATASFFINLNQNTHLDYGVDEFGYTVFGRVVAGMEVVDAIAAAPTTTLKQLKNIPTDPPVILQAEIINAN